ncbi:MAG: glycosyltransferase family 39 protein [Acidobacteriia bacterium]|nr:glycosyltransferase family 39 protein [Terriglobia bacterium]
MIPKSAQGEAVRWESVAARLSKWPSPGHVNLWLAALVALSIFRFWVTPLGSSFWVDEMGTAFVVQHGADDPTLKVAPQVPASIYYALPAAVQKLFGFSEIGYRFPSVVALCVALLFIARIAERLIAPGAGWFAAFACLLIRDFNFEAADARPYALATCITAAAIYWLIRWLDRARWSDAGVFVVLAALVWRAHLVLWPLYILFAIYTLGRLSRRDTAVRWWQGIAVFGVAGVLLIPVVWEALRIYRGAGAHVVVDMPGSADLIRSLKLDLILPVCAAAALVARGFRWPRVEGVAAPGAWTLMIGWWLTQPLSLYAFSRITGNSVFVPRYLSIALPGAALMATGAAAAFVPASQWKRMAVFAGILLLVFMGRWNRVLLIHSGSDWRAAAQQLERATGGAPIRVICPSPFIEAKWPVWRPDYPIQSFLYSHLLLYRTPGKLYPFPFTPSPEAAEFAAELTRNELSSAGRFFLYGADKKVEYWRAWFSARPEFESWSVRKVGSYGDVEIDEFARERDGAFPRRR